MKVKLVIGFCVIAISLLVFNEVRYKPLEGGASVVTFEGQCEGDFHCVDVEEIEGGTKITVYNQNTVNLLRQTVGLFNVKAQNVRSNSWDMVMTEQDDQVLLTIHARFRGDLTPSTRSIEANRILYLVFPFEGVVSFENELEFWRYMMDFMVTLGKVGEATIDEPFVFYRMESPIGDEPTFYVGDQSYYISASPNNTYYEDN